jgi:hypothetical protein
MGAKRLQKFFEEKFLQRPKGEPWKARLQKKFAPKKGKENGI